MIKNIYKVLKKGGKFFLEVRSIHDELYGKGNKVGENAFIYNGHYRRFIKKELLEKKLVENGFKVEYSCEDRGFAPFGNDDPPVIRMILRK